MEKITPASSTVIPTVDLSPFMDGGDKSRQKEVMDEISKACTNLGVFNIENHGVPLDKCEEFLKLNNEFFSYPDEKKTKSTEEDSKKSGLGYGKMHDKFHKFEYLYMHSPETRYNGVPNIPDDYREIFEEVFNSLVKTAQILEDIINDTLGLPKNFLKTYNDDRSWDYMMPMYYTPLNESEKFGIVEHEDPNFITITLEDDVSGLEVYDDGDWIPTIPTKVKMVVVMSDLVQVLSNKKYKHVTHRAFKNKENTRLAIDFCYNFGPNKWIEPLLLTKEIGVKPVYKGFVYKDYVDLVAEFYKNPPIDITYYEI